MRRCCRNEDGFTLIELLVVIIILGILAAIIIFAVGTFTSDSQDAACVADYKTLTHAEEARLAHDGTYAEEADLVSQNYVLEASDLYDIDLGPGGVTYTVIAQSDPVKTKAKGKGKAKGGGGGGTGPCV
jgi:prepilin-type N-terminal cleavage/methylation domain-containing protein